VTKIASLLAAALVAVASPLPAGLTLPRGFHGEAIAIVQGARELAIAPNGDLFVGTEGTDVYVIPHAQAGTPGAPRVFWSHPRSDRGGDAPNAGVALSLEHHALYVAGNTSVWMIPYRAGELQAPSARLIARVRTGSVAPRSDGDVHATTSVAVTNDTLFVSVGSSCNACREVDPTRAIVFQMPAAGGTPKVDATHIRNAIALAVDPSNGHLWVAGAGQDDLPPGHPYEFADDLSARHGVADYGWPSCEENRVAYVAGSNCSRMAVPIVELPAYSTVIGAVFYPEHAAGPFAFPAPYRGGLFLAAHGSWHRAPNGAYAAVPQVVFVPMRDGRPASPVHWNDPRAQWRPFFSGFEQGPASRVGRPTGIIVSPDGSLFVAEDETGDIYRIRTLP
jgi:glucose/arabinose dehydrogenase